MLPLLEFLPQVSPAMHSPMTAAVIITEVTMVATTGGMAVATIRPIKKSI